MKKILWTILLSYTMTLTAESNPSLLFDGNLNALLIDKKAFYVSVSDEVTGGCLPKPNQLKTSMESTLRNNGFEILEKNSPQTTQIHLSALGFKINGMCVVDLTVNMFFPIKAEVPYAGNVPGGAMTYLGYDYSVGRHIFNYRRNKMQKKLNQTVKYYGDQIYMKISKAKDNIFKKFPSIEQEMKKNSN